MNKQIEQKIDLFKLWLTVFIAIDSGSIAWLVNNLGKINDWLKLTTILTIVAVTLLSILINNSVLRKIRRLKE